MRTKAVYSCADSVGGYSFSVGAYWYAGKVAVLEEGMKYQQSGNILNLKRSMEKVSEIPLQELDLRECAREMQEFL